MMLFLPKSVHLGLPLSLLESQPRLIYEPERWERAQIRGSLSDFTAPFGVQGWDGMMGLPDFQIARVGLVSWLGSAFASIVMMIGID